ncbi:unnamed protein product [Amoebophrya sp. A25]|nr:unnamed protein product [Amoebophrya sp. A25]|eukprot:GSA25T00006635001.1
MLLFQIISYISNLSRKARNYAIAGSTCSFRKSSISEQRTELRSRLFLSQIIEHHLSQSRESSKKGRGRKRMHDFGAAISHEKRAFDFLCSTERKFTLLAFDFHSPQSRV